MTAKRKVPDRRPREEIAHAKTENHRYTKKIRIFHLDSFGSSDTDSEMSVPEEAEEFDGLFKEIPHKKT